ncbi:hypothetical protein TgHK011_006164 [Trichoderma gracile]|nr:hypothetical protein TgHK011_006164 [Trichoderma gracile]
MRVRIKVRVRAMRPTWTPAQRRPSGDEMAPVGGRLLHGKGGTERTAATLQPGSQSDDGTRRGEAEDVLSRQEVGAVQCSAGQTPRSMAEFAGSGGGRDKEHVTRSRAQASTSSRKGWR